jgi:protein tyrosine/serine phosphatase
MSNQPPNGAQFSNRSWRVAALAIVLIGAGGGAAAWRYAGLMPKRFGTVVEGRLYRSGEVTPAQLERVQRAYGVRRVISCLDPNAPESIAERQAAARLGIIWENVPLRGDGSSTPEDRARIVRLLTEPDAPPTLMHCAAGANRTGLACGLYRILVQHWTYEQALDEMRRYGFDNLPKHENLRQALREAAASRH